MPAIVFVITGLPTTGRPIGQRRAGALFGAHDRLMPVTAVPDAITQSLYRMAEDLGANGMRAEGFDVGNLGDFARDVRNHRLQHDGLRSPDL
jgi:hypothetical protein